MNGDSLVLDTNIVLYLLSGDETLAELLYRKQIYLSFITELEVLSFSKISKSEQRNIQNFISECTVFDINQEIKKSAIDFRLKYGLKLPDAIVAATSAYINFPLFTSDKDFKNLKELNIILYER